MERKRTIVWDDPIKNKQGVSDAMSGLDYLKAIKDGRISPPPIAMLLGYHICEIENGRAVFELKPGEYHYNPFATVHGGVLSALLDSTMGAAVLSTLPKGMTCSTIEIKVNFVRPVTVESDILRCEAKPIHIGKRLATAEARLTDREGKLYAHGTGTCAIVKI